MSGPAGRRLPRRPAVASLWTSTKWSEAFAPVPGPSGAKGRRGAGEAPGFYVASLRAKANADNASILRQAFETTARVGAAPYLTCTGANVDLRDPDYLYRKLTRGGWVNAADGFPDEFARTYGAD